MARDANSTGIHSHLDTGEPVQSYVTRTLPTIEDRVEAYIRTAQAQDEAERQDEPDIPRYDEYDRRRSRQYKIRVMVAVGAFCGGAIFLLLRWASLSEQEGSRQLTSVETVLLVIAASLAASAAADWFIRGRDLRVRRNLDNEQGQRERRREQVQRTRQLNRDRDIAFLRTGRVPGTLEGLGRLGLSALASSTPEGQKGLAQGVGSRTVLSRMDYREYLQTPHWQQVRSDALRRAGCRCQLDASHTKRLQVHHNNYDCLWNEEPEDVIVLCDDCHRQFHVGGRMPGRAQP
jgi:hypothetical protein